MQKILWLDDEPLTISYDKNTLIPETFDTQTFEICYFEKIAELMEYLYDKSVSKEDIFIVDIMLLFEENIQPPHEKEIKIPNELMAGVTLYTEYLRHHYPKNPTILYTSREHEGDIFTNITSDPRYQKDLFLIDKWQKDTKFLEVLAHFLKDRS